ncbi:hypothetical protein C0J52_00122 [Blattella germanica]|nr:hypothetical protein C0J52_00122 [Blattella germanica]
MNAILPSLQYFEFVVVRILLVISGVETNPGPTHEKHNSSNNSNKASKLTREQTSITMASDTGRGTSILRTMYETGAMILHKGDSNQDLSRMPDIQEHRRLLTRLDSKKNDTSSESLNKYDMPMFKSPSLEVLSKVISHQNNKTIEEKLHGVIEEVRRMKNESRAQIIHLTREIERLEKRTQEQQEDIVHLLNESAQFREQLSSSLIDEPYDEEGPEAGSYWSNADRSHSTDTLDVTDSSFRVSLLRAKFEIGAGNITGNKSSNGEILQSKNNETSHYVSNYVNNISKRENGNIESNSTIEETVQFKSSRSVSDLKEYFERAAGKTQRSKSLSGFDDIQQLRLAAVQNKGDRVDGPTEVADRIEFEEKVLPYSVIVLLAVPPKMKISDLLLSLQRMSGIQEPLSEGRITMNRFFTLSALLK